MKSLRSIFLLGAALVALAACGSVKEDLGLGRSAPDEFAVIDRPPLSMPPDFGLRPPTPGAPRPQEVDLTQRANDTLFAGNNLNAAPTASVDPSDAEKALLTETGADKAPPDIRSIINHESAEKVVASEHLVDDLLWWKKDARPGAVVDAAAEAERIKNAKDAGQPLNQTATPIIERQKSSWLGL